MARPGPHVALAIMRATYDLDKTPETSGLQPSKPRCPNSGMQRTTSLHTTTQVWPTNTSGPWPDELRDLARFRLCGNMRSYVAHTAANAVHGPGRSVPPQSA